MWGLTLGFYVVVTLETTQRSNPHLQKPGSLTQRVQHSGADKIEKINRPPAVVL